MNFLNFHLKWEVKTYAEVKVGDFHAVSKFPLGHYAQGETRNVGCKEKQKNINNVKSPSQCLKIAKMSHSTMRAKRATFIVRLPDRSILKGQKLVENDRIVKPK